MTPQCQFAVMAPIVPERESALRKLLDSMTGLPGHADPRNRVLPFAEFPQLHFARLVLLDDAAMGDLALHGRQPPPRAAPVLALMGECDGQVAACLADLAARAGAGLRQLFSHCDQFDTHSDLLDWMLAHDHPAAAFYVHRRGRTVRQVHEESALRLALAARVPRQPVASSAEAQQRRRELAAFVDNEIRAGRLTLTAPMPTPLAWQAANLAHLAGIALLALAALPLFVMLLPLLAAVLRVHEKRDPEFCPRPDGDAVHAMECIEDHSLSNQFTAAGPVKPGLFRRWLVLALLALLDYACRHLFKNGLARAQTLHFARWILIDNNTRVVFASNYDGGQEAYMDDFINKVGWGLNLIFSSGVGFPRTAWLVQGGARREQPFKRYLRRHQRPSQVWYKAYPGLTCTDLDRASQIREGLQRPRMSDAEALAWLRLL
jgi:hypothetical protein